MKIKLTFITLFLTVFTLSRGGLVSSVNELGYFIDALFSLRLFR